MQNKVTDWWSSIEMVIANHCSMQVTVTQKLKSLTFLFNFNATLL